MKPHVLTPILNYFRQQHNAEFREVLKEEQKRLGYPDNLHDIIELKNIHTGFTMLGIVSVKTDRFEKIAYRDQLYRQLPHHDNLVLIAVDPSGDPKVRWVSAIEIDAKLKQIEYRVSGRGETVFLLPWEAHAWADETRSIWAKPENLNSFVLQDFLQDYKLQSGSSIERLISKVFQRHTVEGVEKEISVKISMTTFGQAMARPIIVTIESVTIPAQKPEENSKQKQQSTPPKE